MDKSSERRRKKRDKAVSFWQPPCETGLKKLKPSEGLRDKNTDDKKMTFGRGRTSGSSEDRLGKIQSDNRGSSREGDRLGRIQSDWMLPEAATTNATSSSASISSNSLFSSSSLGAHQQLQTQQQPPVIPQTSLETTAPEAFKGGRGGGDTVSTCTSSIGFSSMATATTTTSSTSTISNAMGSRPLPPVIPQTSQETTAPESFIGGGGGDTVSTGSLPTWFSSVGATETTTSTSSTSNAMGSPLAGFTSLFSYAAGSAPAQQPTIRRATTNPPIATALFGGLEDNTTIIPLHFGGASSVYTAGVSSLGTGTNTMMDEDLVSSIFGPAEDPFAIPPHFPPAYVAPAPAPPPVSVTAAPVLDDSAERAMLKKTDVPKAALHCWYGQKPRRQIISQNNYVTWHDNGPPHLMHYTSLFICPMSGEAFGSGRFGDEKHYNTNNNNPNSSIVWYKRKALAEHGAAARAFDCLVFRERQAAGIPGSTMAAWAASRIGKDEPYLASAATPKTSTCVFTAAALAVPSHVPSHLRSKVEEMIRQGQAHMAHAPPPTIQGKDGNDDDNVDEAAWKKNEYERQDDRQSQQQSSQQYDDQEMQQNEFDMQKAIFGDP